MLELLDYIVILLLGLLSFFTGAFVTLKLAKPALLKSLRGVGLAVGNQVSKSLAETVENIDVGEIMGQLGGGEGGVEGLGAISGLLGGEKSGIGNWIALLTQLGGKNKGGGGSSGW